MAEEKDTDTGREDAKDQEQETETDADDDAVDDDAGDTGTGDDDDSPEALKARLREAEKALRKSNRERERLKRRKTEDGDEEEKPPVLDREKALSALDEYDVTTKQARRIMRLLDPADDDYEAQFEELAEDFPELFGIKETGTRTKAPKLTVGQRRERRVTSKVPAGMSQTTARMLGYIK